MSTTKVNRAQTPISPKPDIEPLPEPVKFIDFKQLIPLNIRFFFAKEKNKGIKQFSILTESDLDNCGAKGVSNIKKFGKALTWLIDRHYYHPKCTNNGAESGFPAKFENVQEMYARALLSLVSFQFVIGLKFIPPVFTLGSREFDTRYPIFCNDPKNKEFKVAIVDREDTRKFISDMLLLFHIKSDINDENITLVCGEVLQRAGRGNYRSLKFMLIKFIYQSKENSPKIETFIADMVNSYLNKEMFKYCLMSKENQEKYVDWLTNY